jgi:hypothetical protein
MGSEKPITWDAAFDDEVVKVTSRREIKERVRETLVGLAFSGGGIRSATFGLGILEGLKPFGLLKKIDYLSTVSGGGYIGAWLSANCKRAAERKAAPEKAPADPADKAAYERASVDWLDKGADWTESIRHLRRYSNYLSPQVGFFSADTWSMAAIWIRNTLLVQLTVILAIAVALLLPRPLFEIFQAWPQVGDWRWTTVVLFVLAVAGIAGNQLRLNRARDVPLLLSKSWAAGLGVAGTCIAAAVGWGVLFDFHPFTDDQINWIAVAPIALLLVLTGFYLLPAGVKLMSVIWPGEGPPKQINYSQGWVQAVVVVPMMATGYLVAAVLWGQTVGVHAPGELAGLKSYGGFFMTAWRYWPLPLCIAFASLWLLSFCSIRSPEDMKGRFAALFAPVPAVVVLYALLCAIMLLFHTWEKLPDGQGIWLAFVWGPAMVLYAFSLSIVILIGIMGRQSTESVREWWSRLGAWLGIYGAAWTLIAIAAVYGPQWAAIILDSDTWKGRSVIGGWLATTLAGLLAGKSDSTGGGPKNAKSEKTTTEKVLDLVATVGPFVFIAGLLIGVSTCLHLIILSISDQNWSTFGMLHGGHWGYLTHSKLCGVLAVMGATFACLLLLAARVDINEFSLNAFYRSRLSRCYLGATRFLSGERSPQNFTGFDEKDDLHMADLGGTDDKTPAAGPLHIVNCALNLGGSSDLALHTRHSASFTLNPYTAGSSYLSRDPSGVRKAKPLGYQPIAVYGGADGQPTLGQAISVSGAAASPNMGYHTSPVVAFLLTVFNVRLGWWFPNPKESNIKSPSPWFSLRYLVKELFGGADEKSNYLMISDGGHFENLAAYELVRRRCRVIIISDAEYDPELQFEGLGSLIRMCEVDFGARVMLDVGSIRLAPTSNWSSFRCAVGQIDYGDGFPGGLLIYLKASMTGHEDSAVLQYKASHANFPHESTGDQFYGEDQFESYRRLGREVAGSTFGSVNCNQDFVTVAGELLGQFPPSSK